MGSDTDYQWSQKYGDYYYLLNSSGEPLSVSSVRSSDYVFITKENNTISYGLGYNPQNVSSSNLSLLVEIEAIQVANIENTFENIKTQFDAEFQTTSTSTHTVTFNIDGTNYTKSGVAHEGSIAFSSVNSAVLTAVGDSTFNGFGFEENGLALITKTTTNNHSHISSDGLSLCNITENLTLYLGVSSKTYTVSFMNIGQTLQTSQVVAGEKAVYTGETPAKFATEEFAFKFKGWLCSSDGVLYRTNDLPAISQDCTFTAQFAQKENLPVELDSNGGTLETDGLQYDENGEITDFPTPTRGIDRFDGWKVIESENNSWPVGEIVTTSHIVEAVSKDSGYYTLTDLNTAYPWTYNETKMEWVSGNYGVQASALCKITFNVAGTYTIKFRGYSNGYYSWGVISKIGQTLTTYTAYKTTSSVVNYTFYSKVTEPYQYLTYENVSENDYITILYYKSDKYSYYNDRLQFQVQPHIFYTGNVTLEAQWTNGYEITFDANGGTCTTAKKIAHGVYGELPFAKQSGKTFNGWWTQPTGGTQVKSTTSAPTSNTTLYAQWLSEEKQYIRIDENNDVDWNGEYVYFGEFPKTIKANDVTVDETTTDSRGYYKGSDGEWYEKISASTTSTKNSFSDGTLIASGTEYYFKVEAIKWRILNPTLTDGTAMLFSEDILNAGIQFYTSMESSSRDMVNEVNGKKVYPNNYKYSNIRAYLNGENGSSYGVADYSSSGTETSFISKAFSSGEQGKILQKTIDNSKASFDTYKTLGYECSDTSDKIFLLSYKELLNGVEDYGFTSNSKRWKKSTDYAKANNAYVGTATGYENGIYWTRSPYSGNYPYVHTVNEYGQLKSNSGVTSTSYGIAPACWITL